MKIPALFTLLLAAALSALPLSQARADDVSFDVFYNSLGEQGDWYNTPDYGYVWQPSIAYQNDKWRPYSDGYWAQTDDGWTWVSYEDFGWATYHYGRWTQLEDTGWVWVPGYQWGPGWVSWRTNDAYVGWAPLPPKPHHYSNGGQGGSDISIAYNDVEPEEGYTSNVDIDYDIGPTHYCFVPVHDFGAPVLVNVIVPPAQNITIIEHTTNVTNVVYQNGGNNVVVINNGPNFQFLSHHVNHPIPFLHLEQHNDINYLHEHLKGGNPTVVKNNTLFVPSPFIDHRRVNFNQIKPPTVKRDIREARVDHGWRNSGADQPTVQRLRNQFQQQARENPSRLPGNPGADNAGDPRREHERDRANVPPAPGIIPTPGANQPANRTDDERRARRDAAQREREAREATRGNGSQPAAGADRDARRQPGAQDQTQPFAATPTPSGKPNQDQRRRDPRQSDKPAASSPTPADNQREDRQSQRRQHQDTQSTATPNAASQDERRNPRAQERAQPATPPAQASPADSERRGPRQQTQDRTQEQRQQIQDRTQEQRQQAQQTQERVRAREQQQQQRVQEQAQQRQQDQQRTQEQRQRQPVQQEQKQAAQPEQTQRRQEPQAQQTQRNQQTKSEDDKKKRDPQQ